MKSCERDALSENGTVVVFTELIADRVCLNQDSQSMQPTLLATHRFLLVSSKRDKKLSIQTLGTFLFEAIVLGILLFLPAWTLNYWQAWVFIVVFGIATNAIGVYLSLKDPELLEQRKKEEPAAETRMAQKIIISILTQHVILKKRLNLF